jgi:hypothetical protein
MRHLVPVVMGCLVIVGLLSVLCVVRARKLGALPPALSEIGRSGEASFPPEREYGQARGFLWFDVRREESSDTSAVFSSTG